MLKKRWQQINQLLFKRQVPHAVLSWRYFMPGQSTSVKLHRKVFLNAWPALPRVGWFLIALYSYALWYFFFSWRHLYLAWKNNSAALYRAEGIARGEQLYCLFLLAIFHAIPPRFYYQYRLYAYLRKEWLNFIYTHELPQWHLLMSPKASPDSKALLTDKKVFCVAMHKRGLPTIDTLDYLEQGCQSFHKKLFQKRSVFLKPNKGSGQRGCCRVLYQDNTQEYTLINERRDIFEGEEEIARYTKCYLQKSDWLIQPLLTNHEWLAARHSCQSLLTIRLVTASDQCTTKSICATLEIPLSDNVTQVYPMAIECDSGRLLATPRPQCADEVFNDVCEQIILINQQFENVFLPQWELIKSTAEQAHLACLDISSIGWDLALTSEGLKLLEGNFNWGVYAHQRLDNQLIENFIMV